LSASQPTVRPGSTSAVAPDFSHKKFNCFYTSLRNCCSKEVSSTVPLSFLLSSASFLFLLPSYKKVRTHKRGVDQLSQLLITVTQKTAACTYEHNYETHHLFEVQHLFTAAL